MEGGKGNKIENENESQGNPWKRKNCWTQEGLKKKGNSSRKTNILVFDRSSNIPTHASITDDGNYTYVGGIDGKKFLVDKMDFVAMNEVMNQWRPLYYRSSHKGPRFITALHALKEFLQVDDENGSYKIIKVDLSRLVEESNRNRKSNIRVVPSSVGKLTQLQELDLTETDISTVPSEILLGCKRLKVLNLSYTKNLLQLPNAIMNLSELRELYLQNSGIQSLPHHSILTKLRKLELLDLSGTYNLGTMRTDGVPSDGDEKLLSLRKLNLRHSALLKKAPSPPSPSLWDNLIKPFFLSANALVDLDLGGAKHIKSLEDVVLHTSMLERLNLSCTDLAVLPHVSSDVYDKLVHLKVLSLTSTPVLRKYPQQQKAARTHGTTDPPLQTIALKNHLSRLGCLGLRAYQTDGFVSHRKLRHILALNRARYRLVSLWNNKNGSEDTSCKRCKDETKECKRSSRRHHFPVALWPILLSTRAVFKPYEECNDKSCDCQRLLDEKDALFQLLVTFGNEIFGQGRGVLENQEEKENGFVVVADIPSDPQGWTLL